MNTPNETTAVLGGGPRPPANQRPAGPQATAQKPATQQAVPAAKSAQQPASRATTVPPSGKAAPAQSPHTAGAGLSISAVVGFVLSALGFLFVPMPFGLWLGYRGREETTAGKRDGAAFAKWAIWLGWTWLAFWVLALIAFLWILI